jgi:signal transduction histidine kinase
VHLNKVFHTATFRLASLYVVFFAISVAALGAIAYVIISFTLERRLHAQIEAQTASLLTSYRSGGLAQLEDEVNRRERTQPLGPLKYLVVGSQGKRLAGTLSKIPEHAGWSVVDIDESNGDAGQLAVFTSSLDGGGRLAVAADREDVGEVKTAILDGLISAFGAVVVLGIVGGIALSHAFLKRVETIRRTAEAIIAGDLSRRVPIYGTDDDLDRLSQTLNHMLDRIAELMGSLQQVSADIAHDLKTPLARLRRRLELARFDTHPNSANGSLIDTAIQNVDGILATFDALLRIAQIEAGTRRSGFREFDLSEVFTIVVEAFVPSAEEAGKTLISQITPNISFLGDRELITQMLANLVENAIRHTPEGARIDVSLYKEPGKIAASVSDNGPGVPSVERERIFRRLYRLDQNRSTPGSGLGLSLVKAIADLHGISLEVLDAHPGLRIDINFPTDSRKTRGASRSHWLRRRREPSLLPTPPTRPPVAPAVPAAAAAVPPVPAFPRIINWRNELRIRRVRNAPAPTV